MQVWGAEGRHRRVEQWRCGMRRDGGGTAASFQESWTAVMSAVTACTIAALVIVRAVWAAGPPLPPHFRPVHVRVVPVGVAEHTMLRVPSSTIQK
eukprot:366006-Chlamydomonas_euryale.AAC.12